MTVPGKGEARSAGRFCDRHYTEWVQEVKQLKRDGNLDEALVVLMGCIDAVEDEMTAQGWHDPAPWYYEQAAIVHRKRKDYAAEVAVLERYFQALDGRAGHPDLAARRRKAREPLETTTESVPACPSCGSVLEPPPPSSGSCPYCSAQIVVRTTRGVARYLTEEASQAEKAWATQHAELEAALRRTNWIGCTDEEFLATEVELGPAYSPNDVFWRVAHAKIEVLTVEQSSQWADRVSRIYQAMASQLVEEGRDWSPMAVQAVRFANIELSTWADPDSPVRSTGCQCGACAPHQFEGTLSDALARSPVPHTDCEHPPCACQLQTVGPGSSVEIVIELPGQSLPSPQSGAARSSNGLLRHFRRRS